MKGIVKCSVAMYQDEVKWIVPCEYSALNVSKYGYVIVQKDSLLGVYSLYGDVILPCEYNSIAYDKDYDLFTISKNNLYGLARSSYGVLFKCKYSKEDIYNFIPFPKKNSETFMICSNGKYGLSVGQTEEVILPCAYDSFAYATSPCVIAINGKQAGVYNCSTKKWLIPMGTQSITYGDVSGVSGYEVTDAAGHSVCYDTQGNQVYTFPGWPKRREATNKDFNGYDHVSQSVSKLPYLYYAAHDKAAQGYTHLINDRGVVILNLQTARPVSLVSYELCAKRNGRMGLIDTRTGKLLAPYAFDGFLATHIVNGVFRNCMYNNTTTGRTLFVYENGRFLAKKTFARSESRSENRFLQDYLGYE